MNALSAFLSDRSRGPLRSSLSCQLAEEHVALAIC